MMDTEKFFELLGKHQNYPVSLLNDLGFDIGPFCERGDALQLTQEDISTHLIPKLENPEITQWLPIFYRLPFPDKPQQIDTKYIGAVLRLASTENDQFVNNSVTRELKSWVDYVLSGLEKCTVLPIISLVLEEDIMQRDVSAFYFMVLSCVLHEEKTVSVQSSLIKNIFGLIIRDITCEKIFSLGSIALGALNAWFVTGYAALCHMISSERTRDGISKALGFDTVPDVLPTEDEIEDYLNNIAGQFSNVIRRMVDIGSCEVDFGTALNAYGKAVDELIADRPSYMLSFSDPVSGWLMKQFELYVERIDQLLSAVFERCNSAKFSNEDARELILVIAKQLEASLGSVVRALSKDGRLEFTQFDFTTAEEEATKEEVENVFKSCWDGATKSNPLQVIIEKILNSLLHKLDPFDFLNGNEYVVRRVRELLSVTDKKFVCEECQSFENSQDCSVCFMENFCGENTAEFKKSKRYLTPRDECNFVEVESMIKDTITDVLDFKAEEMANRIKSVFEEIHNLKKKNLLPEDEDFKREADRIRGKIPSKYTTLRIRIEEQLMFISQNVEAPYRMTNYEKVNNTLVATGWSVSLSEAIKEFNGYINLNAIVLAGTWDVILDMDVAKIPGICLTIQTNILDIKGTRGDAANDGQPTCTIDTSGANGEHAKNGEDGTQGASQQRGRPGGNGHNGTPGQSAGHVTIKAQFTTGGTVQVIANGGDGGNGGNGGDGKDGVDGKSGVNGCERLFIKQQCYWWPWSTVLYSSPYDPILPGHGGHAGRGGAPGGGGLKGKVNIPKGRAFLTPCSQDGRIGQRGKDGMIGKMGKYGNPGKGYIFARITRWLPLPHFEYSKSDGYPENKTVEWILGTEDYESCGYGKWRTSKVNRYGFPRYSGPEKDEIMIDGKIEKRSKFSGSVVGVEGAAVSATECAEISLDTLAKQCSNLRALMSNCSSSGLNSSAVAHGRPQQSVEEQIWSDLEEVNVALQDLSLRELFGNFVEKRISVPAHYQKEKVNTRQNNNYDRGGGLTIWPRLSCSFIFREKKTIIEWENYMHRVSKAQEKTDVQLMQCLQNWVTAVYKNGAFQDTAYADNIYNEFVLNARRLLSRMEIEEIISQLSELNNEDMLPFRYEYYRALAARHVRKVCNWPRPPFGELVSKERAARRLACERLGTCGYSEFDEQIAKSGACALCPLDILCALNSEWGEMMRDQDCDVTEFFINSTFGATSSAKMKKNVESFDKKIASKIKSNALAPVWCMKETTLLYRWLRSLSQKDSSSVRDAVVSFFEEDLHTLSRAHGKVPIEAFQLLRSWTQTLEEEHLNNGSFFCRAVVKLAQCERRSTADLPEKEKELWRKVVLDWIITDCETRNTFIEEHASPCNGETQVVAYLKSLLDTAKRLHSTKKVLRKIEQSSVIKLVGSCLCKQVLEALPPGGAKKKKDEAQVWLSIFLSSSKCFVPMKRCNDCEGSLNDVISEMYKEYKNIPKNDANSPSSNEVFEANGASKSLASFEENAKDRLKDGNQIACLWHSEYCLSRLLAKQQESMVCVSYRNWEIPSTCKALLEKPPQDLKLDEIVNISKDLVPLLEPVGIPDGLKEAYQSILDDDVTLQETNLDRNNLTAEHQLILNEEKRTRARKLEKLLQKIHPQKQHILRTLCNVHGQIALPAVLEVLEQYSIPDWVRQIAALLLKVYLNAWSPGYFMQGKPCLVFHNFVNYCDEDRLLWFLSLVMKEFKECIPTSVESNDPEEVEQKAFGFKTRAMDIQLIMEALDGMGSEVSDSWLNDKPKALVEYVTALQQAKFDYVYSMWIEEMLIDHPQYHLKEELRGWMLAVEEPRCGDFIHMVRSLSLKDIEKKGPLQSLLNIDDFALCPKIKLDLAINNYPQEWEKMALMLKKANAKRMLGHERCDWRDLRESNEFDPEKIDVAEKVFIRLKSSSATTAQKDEFVKQYNEHAEKRAEAAEFERRVFSDQKRLVDVLFIICDTLKSTKMEKDDNLYPVQVLSIVLLIQNGALGNIETGEGKTFISGCCMAFKAYCGYMVDVVTSSQTLSGESEAELGGFLKALFTKKSEKEKVSAVLSSNAQNDPYKLPIVFGTMTQYVTDTLVQENVPESYSAMLAVRNTCVRFMIIDEADLPMLNDFAHVVYLSLAWLAGRKIAPGLLAILEHLLAEEKDAPITETVRQKLRQSYLRVVQPLCKRDDDSALSVDRCNKYINSAITAVRWLRDGCDYVVMKKITVPYNAGTGEVQHGMSWQDGMSAFVSLLHGKAYNEESLAPIFQSFFSFLVSYKGRMCGLTGTVGCWRSRRVFEDHYGLRAFHMPRAHYRDFVLDPPTAKRDENERDKCIVDLARSKLKKKQSVLIITRFQADAKTLCELLQAKVSKDSTHLYIEGTKPQLPEDRPIVIVATAIAGRGTDFKVPAGQKDGLFVILTFCASDREVRQAYGRAARQKDKGGATSIVAHKSESYREAQNEAIIAEKKRLEQISGRDALKLSLEEELRQRYSTCIQEVLKELSKKDKTPNSQRAYKEIADKRFGLWMSNHSDEIFRTSASVESRGKHVVKMLKDVAKPIKEWSKKPTLLQCLDDPEEILKAYLFTQNYSECGLTKAEQSALEKAELKCSFGSIPYVLAYTHLVEASKEKDAALRDKLFHKARICLKHAIGRFQQWKEVYRWMRNEIRNVCLNTSSVDGFKFIDDHFLVMEHHLEIALKLCGTMRLDPEMFADSLGSSADSRSIFEILLNRGLVEDASVNGSIEIIEKKIKQPPHLQSIQNICKIDNLCEALRSAQSSNTVSGVNLFECLPCQSNDIEMSSNRNLGASRVQLWQLLTDEQCGVINPFKIADTYRNSCDETLKKELDNILKGAEYGHNDDLLSKVHSVICQSMGCLRTEVWNDFSVSLSPLDKVIRNSKDNNIKTVPQTIEFFEPICLHKSIELQKNDGSKGYWKQTLYAVSTMAFFGLVSFCAPAFFVTCSSFISYLWGHVSKDWEVFYNILCDIRNYVWVVGSNGIILGGLCSTVGHHRQTIGISLSVGWVSSKLLQPIREKLMWWGNKIISRISPVFLRKINILGEKCAAAYEEACDYLKSDRVGKMIIRLPTSKAVDNSLAELMVKQQRIKDYAEHRITNTSIRFTTEILYKHCIDLQRELFETYLGKPLLQLCAQVKHDCADDDYNDFLKKIKALQVEQFRAIDKTVKGLFKSVRAFFSVSSESCKWKFISLLHGGSNVSCFVPIKELAVPLIQKQCDAILSELKRHKRFFSAFLDNSASTLPSNDPCHEAVKDLMDCIMQQISRNSAKALDTTVKIIFSEMLRQSQVRSEMNAKRKKNSVPETEKCVINTSNSFVLHASASESTKRIDAFGPNTEIIDPNSREVEDYMNLMSKMGMYKPINTETTSVGGLQSIDVFINDDNPNSPHLKHPEKMVKEIQGTLKGLTGNGSVSPQINFYTSGNMAKVFAEQFVSGSVFNVKTTPLGMHDIPDTKISACRWMLMYEMYKKNEYTLKRHCGIKESLLSSNIEPPDNICAVKTLSQSTSSRSYCGNVCGDVQKERKGDKEALWMTQRGPLFTVVGDRACGYYCGEKPKPNELSPLFIQSLPRHSVSTLEKCCLHLSEDMHDANDQCTLKGVAVFDMSGKNGFVTKTEKMKCTVYKVAPTAVDRQKEVYIVAFKGNEKFPEWADNVKAMFFSEMQTEEESAVKNAQIAVDKFGLENVVFTGHSIGGRAAFIAAVGTGGTAVVFNPLLPPFGDIDRILNKQRDKGKKWIHQVKSFVVYDEALFTSLEMFDEYEKLEELCKEVVVFPPENCVFKQKHNSNYKIESIFLGLLKHTIGDVSRAMKEGKCVERKVIGCHAKLQ